tara:strand:- start:17 stop:400 length:384 start_codon:yes stop_codon:yes gene_type:complete
MRLFPSLPAASGVFVTGLIALTVGLSACGDVLSCQNACQKAYRDDQCNFGAGLVDDDAAQDCTIECENALRTNGDLDGYDPDDLNSVDRSTTFELKNEAQAASWMQCVMETSCDDINKGFCPGGGIN